MGGILVTGISGFIGGHVWGQLAERDNVWGVHGATGSVPLKPERQIGVDLSQRGRISGVIEDIRPEVILHIAAIARPDVVRRHTLLAWQVNNAGTKELAQAAAKIGARVIFASSDQVFDGTRGNYREGDPPQPVNIYGETKHAAERSVLSLVDNSVVARINNTFGRPRFRGGSFSEWVLVREGRGENIPLFLDQYRSPIDAQSVSQALIELTDHAFTGILHIGGANRVNRVMIGRMLLQHLGRDHTCILEMHSSKVDPEGRMPADTSFDISLVKQVLHTPMPNLSQALQLAYGPAKAKY